MGYYWAFCYGVAVEYRASFKEHPLQLIFYRMFRSLQYSMLLMTVLLGGVLPVYAQEKTLLDIVYVFQVIENGLIPVAFALAVLFFFWGLAKAILNTGDDKEFAEGKKIMLWGIIALFVISSIWGIVGFFGGVFGIGQGGTCPPPQIGAQGFTTCF